MTGSIMKRKTPLVALLVIIGVILALVFVSQTSQSSQYQFTVKGKTYAITEYEATQQEWQQGLMNVTVTNTTFALFNFSKPSIYSFWMKNTYTPLDMIWVNYSYTSKTGKIVYIVNASPCVNYSSNQTNCMIYTPYNFSNYVIEAKAGFVQKNGINVGDSVKLLSN